MAIDLKSNRLYIIDIRFKLNNNFLLDYEIDKSSEILSLTPYSSYLIEENKLSYVTFHHIINESDFINDVLKEYKELEYLFADYPKYTFLLKDLAHIKTYEKYISVLTEYIKYKKLNNYEVIYLTDTLSSGNENIDIGANKKSHLHECKDIDTIISIRDRDSFFYKKNKAVNKLKLLMFKKKILSTLFKRYLRKKDDRFDLNYDNKYYKKLYESLPPFSVKERLSLLEIDAFMDYMTRHLISDKQETFITVMFISLLESFRKALIPYTEMRSIDFHPFTYLSGFDSYANVLLFQKNKIPVICMQHGSYLQENLFLKYNEILPADLNLVFNEYTKQLFEKRGAKEVAIIPTFHFNLPIKTKKIIYDFLYIPYCTSYGYPGLDIFSESSTLSLDAANIYKRHVEVIQLFGNDFRDKKICIKIQPGILLHRHLYVPFIELSKRFNNIKIEFTYPLSKLIEKSQSILSDYFTSEFINRELHYKKDIILFNDKMIPVPENSREEIEKMFILVDSVSDLKGKIEALDQMVKKRVRDDKIIEFYSSKKFDNGSFDKTSEKIVSTIKGNSLCADL